MTDDGFAHLRGVKDLNMFRVKGPRITDAALAYLRGAHTLKLGWTAFTDPEMLSDVSVCRCSNAASEIVVSETSWGGGA